MSAKPFTASLQVIEHKGEVEAAEVSPGARQQWMPLGCGHASSEKGSASKLEHVCAAHLRAAVLFMLVTTMWRSLRQQRERIQQ